MIEVGKIIELYDEKAKVRIERHSLCSKCTNNCHLAGENHEKENIEVMVDNVLGAREGQLVKLEMSEGSLVIASLIIYLIPLAALILGYFVGNLLVPLSSLKNGESSGIIGSIVFLLLSFLLVKYFDKIMGRKERYQPKIIKIIDDYNK